LIILLFLVYLAKNKSTTLRELQNWLPRRLPQSIGVAKLDK